MHRIIFLKTWRALQKHIDRPLLAFCAIGKSGVFGIVLLLWLAADLSGRLVLMATGDLALALIWFAWLFNKQNSTAISSGE